MGFKAVGVAATVVLVTNGMAASAAEPALHGDTIFLPNVDDDSRRCPVSPTDLDASGAEVDAKLVSCNDAGDDKVNGRQDEADLARLTAGRVGGRSGRITVDSQARVFVRRGGVFDADTRLSEAELRQGVQLGVEGRDIIRDPAKWDGWVTVTFTVDGQVKARHRMRVAPLVLQNDLQPVTKVFAAAPNLGHGLGGASAPLAAQFPSEWEKFSTPLAQEADTQFIQGTAKWWKDVWWQDLFEPATASMPTKDGIQTMRVAIRSANIWQVPDAQGNLVPTPRPSGRLLFRDLRGPDVGVVQQYTVEDRQFITDLRSATGNIESLPPYEGHPQGRMVYGTGQSMQPDATFITMLTAQGQQPPVVIDTSWLLVGHADETMHVMRANNSRGWTLMVADPRLAVSLFKDVPRETRFFEKTSTQYKPSVGELVDDAAFLAGNEEAARHIDDQVKIMLAETGLRAEELIRVPVLFQKAPMFMAFTPGIPNGLSVTDRVFAAPDPHGPVVSGQDVFRQATERAVAASGVRIRWVDNYLWAHIGGGEVHCTTNAWRDTRTAQPWWTS
ncbi:protein-arginine deiminase family protein [Kibdelosporangium aridum]|uniref:Protein-arginine deiminase n=1 Tax=Kibdelosporangium aridum TaxID=2030 RepID=A0A1W2FK80_KIBAR|nr:protein-arginine deiminase family protein [Kibdelosporangium aridum]SMD22154.1 protein-arginine deiminase [Kibdelosporangium aridum]